MCALALKWHIPQAGGWLASAVTRFKHKKTQFVKLAHCVSHHVHIYILVTVNIQIIHTIPL